MAIGSSILERFKQALTVSVPDVKESETFPYCEVTGELVMLNLNEMCPDCNAVQGKACFLCEKDHATQNLANMHECSAYSPPVTLPKLAQRVLEHMGAHILFNPSIDKSAKPCGLCLRPFTLCVYHFKKGKGAGTSEQVDYTKTTCARKMPFAYAVAATSTPSSPSSNVPICCPIFPTAAPCMWQYNLPHHMRSKHPFILLTVHQSLWQITNAEKSLLKEVWAN